MLSPRISINIELMDNQTATLPGPAALGLCVFSVVLVLIALTDTFAEPDLWGYLNFGRLFFSDSGFPFRDTLAYVPTNKAWIFHEWLTGVVLYRIHQAVGPGGIQVLKYLLGGMTAVMVAATARQRGALGIGLLIPIFLAGAFYSWAFPPFRALCFTYCFFSVFLFVLETARIQESFSGLWVLCPVTMLWANLHGGFLAGPGLVLLYALGSLWEGRRFLPYVKILFACLLVTLINPYGPDLWKTVASHLAQPQHGIREWVSVPGAIIHFGPSYDLLLFLACLGMTAGITALNGLRDKVAILVFGATAMLGLVHHRHMPFFILAYAAFVPSLLDSAWREKGVFTGLRFLPAGCTALCAAAMLFFNGQYYTAKIPLIIRGGAPLALRTPPAPLAPGTEALFYPVHAVDFLESSGFAGNILPYATWGGYISWRLYPRCKVAMDLRFETVYPQTIRDEYFEFLRCGPRWRDFLIKYPHDIVLTYAGDNLHNALAREPGWQEVYQDSHTVIFARKGRPHA